jgi:hypothetical protein
VGDVNGSYSVTSSDVLKVKGSSGLNASASTFTYDLNLSGTDTITDIAIAKANTGQTLP